MDIFKQRSDSSVGKASNLNPVGPGFESRLRQNSIEKSKFFLYK